MLTSLSVAPERAGKVSEGGKPCMPAKTTRKSVEISLSLTGVHFESLGEELGLEMETAL